MRKHYDFSNAIKNPHAGKFKDGYTIVVSHQDYDEVITVKKEKKPKHSKTITSEPVISAPVTNV